MTFIKKISLATKRQFEIVNITKHVESALSESKCKRGTITVFVPHTTAAVKLNHLEPLLLQDIMKMMYRLAPLEASYAHDFFEIRTSPTAAERSNGHAHVKAFLLGSSESIPVENKQMLLGKRQSIFFVELDGPRARECVITVIGE